VRTLILYWNELSFSNAEDVGGEVWARRAADAFEAFQRVCTYRSNSRISVFKGAFHAVHRDRTLLSWLEEWLGRDRLRRIKTRAVQPTQEAGLAVDQLECEVRRDGRLGEGLTRAHLAESWVWSLGNTTGWTGAPVIAAQEVSLTADGAIAEGPVEVMNLADAGHAQHWEERISAWGREVSESCVIADVEGNRVIMYPLDHGYPHVHVESPRFGRRMFKYRVDRFESLTDSPERLDSIIKPWVQQHVDALMESWRRCSKGRHPLKIRGC
jgi:hypothetical protein